MRRNNPGDRYDFEEQQRLLHDLDRRPQQGTAKWDFFQEEKRKKQVGSMADTEIIDAAEKVARIATYIVTFLVVLGSGVISKGTLLFMTSQVVPDTKPFCHMGEKKQFVSRISTTEQVVWIWMLFIVYCIPQIGTFFRSLRVCLFKRFPKPKMKMIFLITFTETLPAIGSALLVYCVLPELDVIKGAMLTNAVCFVPAIVALITSNPKCRTNSLPIILDIISIVAQVSSFVVWPLISGNQKLWLIPVSIFLISFGWWENYVPSDTPIKFLRKSNKSSLRDPEDDEDEERVVEEEDHTEFENSRYLIYLFVSVWKCVVFFVTMLLVFQVTMNDTSFLFRNIKLAFEERFIRIDEIKPIINIEEGPSAIDIVYVGPGHLIQASIWTPVYVVLINAGCTFLCYQFGTFACKILMQGFSYAFPIALTMPAALSALIAMSSAWVKDPCVFGDSIPYYLFFDVPPLHYLKRFIGQEQAWIWLVWLLSQIWITMHIWSPKSERLAKNEKLYVRPMYDPFLIDQDIALNRRKEDGVKVVAGDAEDNTEKNIPKIFCCGTMWHEEKEEMLNFLNSIVRLDGDHYVKKKKGEEMQLSYNRDFYNLETHIFFDDSIEKYCATHENTKKDCNKHKAECNHLTRINKFVTYLIDALSESVAIVYQNQITLERPTVQVLPYGGRLTWKLPGTTNFIVHLKDKTKIRAKKRWSQVMYMYYLLGFGIMNKLDGSNVKELDTEAENTYILALDGDIDFEPKAVTLLLDLMKRKKYLGAACGRIHPIGSGPMAWYQMFEYAVGHWLQKATEHVIGCVLCSPGCFSLFRAKALMENNVMKKYTTPPTEAIHHVQYDQGEDRWLCTLILQQGYKVEYSAASDAFTHCPEGFNEFYNQRRRWMPSTFANILDLLMDYKHTIKINNSISFLYIIYQVVIMVGTILGPGTIFLMLVGALNAAFQVDQWTSFFLNLTPIVFFMVICRLFTNEKIQLFFAALISAIYGLVMMAVLVGIMLQISNDGLLAPSSLFFFCVAGEMIITALLHPKELNCLIYGVVYYITVPSMYLLLVIYSVFNMHVISWGTRDTTPKKKDDEKKDEEEDEKEEKGFSLKQIGRFLQKLVQTNKNKMDDISAKLDLILKKLSPEEQKQEEQKLADRRTTVYLEGNSMYEEATETDAITSKESLNSSINDSPPWMLDLDIPYRPVDPEEEDFWNDMMKQYLLPIVETDAEKQEKETKLLDLRDRMVSAFVMLNSIFVLVVFLLTLKKDLLHLKWPLNVKANFTLTLDTDEIAMTKTYLELEPIGFIFLIFFGILLVIQFIAMLFHRFATFSHIMAHISFNKSEQITEKDVRDVLSPSKVTKKVQFVAPNRRKTIANTVARANAYNRQEHLSTLDSVYERRMSVAPPNFVTETGGGKKKDKSKHLSSAVRNMVEKRKSVVIRSPAAYENNAFRHDE